jgi:hypothetical protein
MVSVLSLEIYKSREPIDIINAIFSVEQNCISLNTISG